MAFVKSRVRYAGSFRSVGMDSPFLICSNRLLLLIFLCFKGANLALAPYPPLPPLCVRFLDSLLPSLQITVYY